MVGQDIGINSGDFTAIACMSDIVAFGVIEGLKQCGIRVPYDMSVIGFDNLPDCELMTPKLTSVAQDFEWKARKAGDYLFKMIESGVQITADEKQHIRVYERQSVRSLNE